MDTLTAPRRADALKVGDQLRTYDGKFRVVTGVDVTPAAVRIRTGRSQQWSRSAHAAIYTVKVSA